MTELDPDRPHRPAAWLGGALVLAAVVVAAWLAFGDRPRSAAQPRDTAAAWAP